ncbi:rRNA methyltransferase [Bisgaardia hudsonensis]|nr:TrmH family RNA methyltransferase [Bisgaardia hudsonensis]QLB13873.1 rRNA methyltransferase [Bisgaardia hudsonensis]
MNTKKTSFQKTDNQKSFNERSVGDKQSPKRSHFSEQSQKENHRNFSSATPSNKRRNTYKSDQNSQKYQPVKKELQVTESLMENASGTGRVKVIVKSHSDNNQSYVKKTGPLSPRAPEKIKKNRSEEMKVYGENACLTLFQKRPESIVRVWATVEMAHRIGDMFSYLATNKKAYHVVDSQELNLVSGTTHHGGICMLVKKRHPFTLDGYLDIPRKKNCLLLLEGVRNSHNIGGIMRTCAFYGISGVIIDDVELLNSASAMRVAEGGMEYIHPLQIVNTETALEKLRSLGYQVIHLTTDKSVSSFDKLSLKSKVVFILSEISTDSLFKKGDDRVHLSYANPLKHGLNISVAAGVLLSKWSLES